MTSPTTYPLEPWECPRCGAMVDRVALHRRWHEHLEGTSEPLPPEQSRRRTGSNENRARNPARYPPRRPPLDV